MKDRRKQSNAEVVALSTLLQQPIRAVSSALMLDHKSQSSEIGLPIVSEALTGWSDRGRPLFQGLARALREAIERGDVTPGGRLPPERALAESLGVSRSTVVAAYELLEDDGLLRRRQGSGTYVKGEAPLRVAPPPDRLEANAIFCSLVDGPRVEIDLSTAAMAASPSLRTAVAALLVEATDPVMATHGYFPQGMPELREAIATRLTAAALPTTPNQVLVTSGAQQGLTLIAQLLIAPGDAVALENPTYPGAIDAFRRAGARLIPVPIERDGVNLETLERVIDRSHPRLLYVIPTHSNPSGAVMTHARRERLGEIAGTTQIPIIEDTALADLNLEGGRRPPDLAATAAGAPILTVGSASKILWGGFRVGWVRGPEVLIGRLTGLKSVGDLGSSAISQAVVARLLSDPGELLDIQRQELRVRRDALSVALTRLLPDWRWSLPRGGLSLWVRIPRGDASAFAEVARRHGVAVLPGSHLSVTGEHRDHLRLPYVVSAATCEAAVRRLAAAWADYVPGTGHRSPPPRVVV